MKKKRVVIAGQTPPPHGGQNVMIAQILDELRRESGFTTVHWPFFFSRTFQAIRRPTLGKVVEVVRCVWRLFCIRMKGPIDLLIYPAGGPHLVPIVRDICLLPFARLSAKRLLIQFHAAGIAEKLKKPSIPYKLVGSLMRFSDAAIVMTNYNRVDPMAVGINKIEVIPTRLADEAPASGQLPVDPQRMNFLYLGHLCPDKGTPALLEAFGNVVRDHPELRLELVGEPLAPYHWDQLHADARRFGMEEALKISGVLTGDDKKEAFIRASVFIFPTVAPYESFGLVMVEAMMFSLPILATDWRGNRDVLGDSRGAFLFRPDAPLAESIEKAVRETIAQRNQWVDWGTENRKRYQICFEQRNDYQPYTGFVQRMLSIS